MDQELLKTLRELLREELKAELKTQLKPINERMENIENRVSGIEDKIDSVESKVDKNSILLEIMRVDVKTLVEGQESHREQNERQFNETNETIEEKTSVIELSLKSISKDLTDTKESIEVLKEMTGKHEVDINILKRRPV